VRGKSGRGVVRRRVLYRLSGLTCIAHVSASLLRHGCGAEPGKTLSRIPFWSSWGIPRRECRHDATGKHRLRVLGYGML
jgi:hypothetical protein